jgi:hypothetical protein
MNLSLSLASPAAAFRARNMAKQRRNSGITRENLIILYPALMPDGRAGSVLGVFILPAI